MKRFIFKLFLFLTPVYLFILITVSYYFYYKSRVVSDLQLISNYECLIMGDSQMQRINPDKFDQPTFNFASSGEHYYFTYQKLIKLLGFKNHHIKQVVLGVSVHNFAPVYFKLLSTNYVEGRSSLSKYLYFIPLNDGVFLQAKDFLTKSMVKGVFDGPYWGGLICSENANPDTNTINTTFEIHYRIQKGEPRFSSEQMKYLTLINELCANHHVELILLTLPYHPLYLKKTDSFYTQLLWQNIQLLNSNKYISYLEDVVNPGWMSDAVHLNVKGADFYTEAINDSINLEHSVFGTEKNTELGN